MVQVTNRAESIRQFIIQQVSEHPSDIGRLAVEKYGISRQSVSRYLRELVEGGLLASTGQTRAREYRLVQLAFNEVEVEVSRDLEEHILWIADILPSMEDTRQNVVDICQYGFTEMVNNVIEHSESPTMEFSVTRTAATIKLQVHDSGVGIFNKIQADYGFGDPRDALLQLTKGKLTTDEERHTGEGIFFTSRMFDAFVIMSGTLAFTRIRAISEDDWLIEADTQAPLEGTEIIMKMSLPTVRTTREVFEAYASELEDYGFTRTHVPIKLARYGNEQLMSRSQAKRVLARFDQFKEAILDFQGVEMIGPAFADEIFRIFPSDHPETQIFWVNTTPAIDQMIQRAKPVS